MRNRNVLRLALAVLALAFALGGCQRSAPAPAPLPASARPQGPSLAVAGFTNPQNTRELLAGCLLEECQLIRPQTLAQLDLMLSGNLSRAGREGFVQPQRVSLCQKVAPAQPGETKRQAALAYWLEVGKCLNSDLLLVPQIQAYIEKDLPEEQPASVTMDFFLLDVRNRRIARRFRFDETQKPLLTNLLDAGTFFKRGGRWISAAELAQEGMDKAIEELGL